MALAASALGIPLYLHESDAVPGLANRAVGRFARLVFLGSERAARAFKKTPTVRVGQVLSEPFCRRRKVPADRPDRPLLLAIGGSQ